MDILHSRRRRGHREKAVHKKRSSTLEFRSSKAFVVAVVAIAFFAVCLRMFPPPLPVQITSQASLGCLHILDGETHRKVIWSTLSGLSRSSLSFLPSSESGHICRMTSVRPCPIMPQLQLIAPVQKWMSILLAVFGSAVLIGSRE